MRSLTARRFRQWLRDCSGANLVEGAIITPLLLFLTFAIVDFGMIFYVYLALANGVSQASRYAVTGQQEANMSREESIKRAMRLATPTLTIEDDAFTFTHLPAGAANWAAGVGGPNDIGKVTVDYTWTLYTPLVRPLFNNGEIHLTVDSAMKNERSIDQ